MTTCSNAVSWNKTVSADFAGLRDKPQQHGKLGKMNSAQQLQPAATGCWDKPIEYSGLRQSQPAATPNRQKSHQFGCVSAASSSPRTEAASRSIKQEDFRQHRERQRLIFTAPTPLFRNSILLSGIVAAIPHPKRFASFPSIFAAIPDPRCFPSRSSLAAAVPHTGHLASYF